MFRARFLLPTLLLLGLPALATMGPPTDTGGGMGTPPPSSVDCTFVTGDLAYTTVSDTSVDGTLAGDLVGTFALTVGNLASNGGTGPVSVSLAQVSGSIADAQGNLNANGRYLSVSFMPMMPPPMGGPTLPSISLQLLRLHLDGGDGAYTDAFGGLRGTTYSFGTMSMNSVYHGIICTPAPEPTPDP